MPALVDALIVHGSLDECRARVAEYQTAGVDTPIIALLPTGGDQVEQVRALAPRA